MDNNMGNSKNITDVQGNNIESVVAAEVLVAQNIFNDVARLSDNANPNLSLTFEDENHLKAEALRSMRRGSKLFNTTAAVGDLGDRAQEILEDEACPSALDPIPGQLRKDEGTTEQSRKVASNESRKEAANEAVEIAIFDADNTRISGSGTDTCLVTSTSTNHNVLVSYNLAEDSEVDDAPPVKVRKPSPSDSTTRDVQLTNSEGSVTAITEEIAVPKSKRSKQMKRKYDDNDRRQNSRKKRRRGDDESDDRKEKKSKKETDNSPGTRVSTVICSNYKFNCQCIETCK